MNKALKKFLSSEKRLPKFIKNYIKSIDNTENYTEKILVNNIWKNDFDRSIPIYNIYHHMHAFLDECVFVDNKAISPSNKKRKVLFLGYDGMRADAVVSIINAKNEYDKSLESFSSKYSGIERVAQNGGLYLAYCGGEAKTFNQQSTSTSAGWISQFTGVWGYKNGVRTNEDCKSNSYKTIFYEYALKGLKTSLCFNWDPFFDTNLKFEIKEIITKNLNISYCDTDRKKNNIKSDNDINDFVTPESESFSAPLDLSVRDYVLSRISKDDDIICGLYDSIDGAGHSYEFSPKCNKYVNAAAICDNYTYQILNVIEEREKKFNEEWLIVLANDHGGIKKGHGGQSLEERTTWIATNRPINEYLFGYNYDGYREHKKS